MRTLRIGPWLVHPARCRMWRGDQSVAVRQQVMEVLVCLARRPGEVVTRETLLSTVWGDVVVSEEGLTVAISELRRLLGDDPKAPRFIETIRKGGYRLVAPVTEVTAAELPDAVPEPDGDQGPVSARRRPRLTWTAVALLAAGLAVVLAGALGLSLGRSPSSAPAVALRETPFTTYPGTEIHPAFSPDGTRIAFAGASVDGESLDLYVKQRNTETALRLTEDPTFEGFPAWSPDGSTIAFSWAVDRHGIAGHEYALATVPAIGGPVRKLVAADSEIRGISWSPDGRWLVYAAGARPDYDYRLWLLAVDTLEKRPLTPALGHEGAETPVFSPDGKTIAYAGGSPFLQDLFLLPSTGGTPRRLTSGQRRIASLDWTSDGEHIVFAAAPTGLFQLWRVAVADAATTRVPVPSEMAARPALSRRGDQLVYQKMGYQCDIWRFRLDRPDGESLPAVRLIASTRTDREGRISPDGTRVTFISNRSGNPELWLCDLDGGRPRQLTAFDGPYLTGPRWSPDGRQIAFTVLDQAGFFTIYRTAVEGGVARRVTAVDRHHRLSRWSRDGRWLYTLSQVAGAWQIRRRRPDGSDGQGVVPVAAELFYETVDGRSLIYLKNDASGIWKWSLADESEECLVDRLTMAAWLDPVVVEAGVYFLDVERPVGRIVFYDFANGELIPVGELPGFRDYMHTHFAISPDGRWLLCDRASYGNGADLIMVEGFGS